MSTRRDLYLTSLFFLLISSLAYGQNDTLDRPAPDSSVTLLSADDLKVADTVEHSPKKAWLRSLIIPGLGQAYNKKYWKIPIIYVALGTSIYFTIDNNRRYNDYRNAYINRQNGMEDDYPQYTDNNLIVLIDFYRRNRDFSIILTAGIHLINVLDAMVDAHLHEFDVSDELSIEVRPQVQYFAQGGYRPAVRFALKF